MKTSIQLSIPKACSEKWENFVPSDKGSFCSSCRKVVVDFTRMTDDEVIRSFNVDASNICGRFRMDQLRAYTIVPAPKINPSVAMLKAGLLSVLVLLISRPSSAQSILGKTRTEQVDQKQSKISTQTQPEVIEHNIKGVVLSSEDGSPLPGVVVDLKGSELGIITNAEGRFEFPKKLKEGEVLLFSFIGLMTEEYTIPKHAEEQFEIKMKMSFALLGEVAVNEVYSVPTSRFHRWWNKVKNLL